MKGDAGSRRGTHLKIIQYFKWNAEHKELTFCQKKKKKKKKKKCAFAVIQDQFIAFGTCLFGQQFYNIIFEECFRLTIINLLIVYRVRQYKIWCR